VSLLWYFCSVCSVAKTQDALHTHTQSITSQTYCTLTHTGSLMHASLQQGNVPNGSGQMLIPITSATMGPPTANHTAPQNGATDAHANPVSAHPLHLFLLCILLAAYASALWPLVMNAVCSFIPPFCHARREHGSAVAFCSALFCSAHCLLSCISSCHAQHVRE